MAVMMIVMVAVLIAMGGHGPMDGMHGSKHPQEQAPRTQDNDAAKAEHKH